MKTNLMLSIAGLLAFNEAHALPTIYPTSTTYLSSISNKTNSNLVADDIDQRVIYVMPPSSATASVLGLHSITSNVGFCKEMADTQNYSRQITAKIADLSMQEAESRKDVDLILEKLSEARKDVADHVALSKLDEIISLDSRLESIELRITELNETLLSCTQFCQQLRAEIQELRAEKIEVTKTRRALAAKHSKEMRDYEKKKAVVEGLKEDLSDREDSWAKINERLISIKNNLTNMYSSFGKMEGARAGIKFKSNWDQNIELLRQENPGFDFKKISTQNAVITTNIIDLDSIPSGGAILGYDIGGNREEGKLVMPAYPEDMSGNIRLSLIGTCPVLHPDYFDINLPNSTDEMNYGLTVSYEYPTAFLAEATATYNMHKMYQKIAKSGSRGGFFRKKSWSSVEERTYFKDSFSVKWVEQDSGNSLSDTQKADLEREMRNNIFARMATIGLPAIANAGALVAPPALSQSGAVVLANSLQKNCPGNQYCVGAAMALNFLDAVFGSSSTAASYTNIQDVDASEKWSRTKVVYKPWISVYNK